MPTPDPRAPAPGLPDYSHIVGVWDHQTLRAELDEAAARLHRLEAEAAAYVVARDRLRSLHKRIAEDRARWANNTEDECAVARAIAYQTDLSAVGWIIHTIELIAGDRPGEGPL